MQTLNVSTRARVNPEDVPWKLLELKPPTRNNLMATHAIGGDPRRLLEQFSRDYAAAVNTDYALITEMVGEDAWIAVAPEFRELSDYVNDHAVSQREAWWTEPAAIVAELENPDATEQERAMFRLVLRSSLTVGHIVEFQPGERRVELEACPTGVRPRTAGRSRARRPRSASVRSSSRSGDSGDDDPHHPEPSAASRPARERVSLCPQGVGFTLLHGLTPGLPGHLRARLFHSLPDSWQAFFWSGLSAAVDREVTR